MFNNHIKAKGSRHKFSQLKKGHFLKLKLKLHILNVFYITINVYVLAFFVFEDIHSVQVLNLLHERSESDKVYIESQGRNILFILHVKSCLQVNLHKYLLVLRNNIQNYKSPFIHDTT